MNDIPDELLGAYVDGELDHERRARVERALAADPSLRARLGAEQALRAALRAHYDPVADEPVPPSLRAMLSPEPEKVADIAAARARRRVFAWPHYGAMAASLAIGLLGGHSLSLGDSSPIAAHDGRIVARGALAEVLETQLASVPSDGDARIGLTFEDREGRYCRTFAAQGLSGIGCREAGAWTLVATAEGEAAATEYRQAAAPLVLEQAEAMMKGAPLGAEAERRIRDRRWRRD